MKLTRCAKAADCPREDCACRDWHRTGQFCRMCPITLKAEHHIAGVSKMVEAAI